MTEEVRITEEEIKKIMDEPMMRLVMEGLAKYDSRYIGNVPREEAEKMFPELKKKDA